MAWLLCSAAINMGVCVSLLYADLDSFGKEAVELYHMEVLFLGF
jgi:hypothetical protein